MRCAITFMLLMLAVVSIDPVCEVNSPLSDKIYNAPNELQALDLSNYFRGYNLQYNISVDSPYFRLIPPFWNNNAKDLPTPVKEGSTRVALDILTDQNLAWRDQGASLLTRDTSGFTVAFADLTSDQLLDFNNDVNIDHAAPTRCFDLAMVDTNIAIVDCQLVDTKGGVQDFHYIVDARTKTAIIVTQSGIVSTTARKTVPYLIGDDVFLLSAVLYNGIDPTFNQSTFISVYHVDQESHRTELVNIIDAATLMSTTLSITDITVNENGIVLVSDVQCAIYQFRYLASNRVDKVGFYKSFDPTNKYLRIASIVDSNNQTTVVVGTVKSLIEFDWKTFKVRYFYELNEFVSDIVDLQMNSRMIMVQTPTDYFFYRLGVVEYRNLLFTTSSLKTVSLISQTIPQAVVVGNLRSLSFVVSNGYLELIRPQMNMTVTVSANSTTASGNSSYCKQSFQITTVDNTTLPYFLADPPLNISMENPAVLRFKLSDYVIGPQLKYDTHITPGVQYDLKHIEDMDMSGPQDGYKYLDTVPLSRSSYYRLSQNGQAIQIDTCEVQIPNKVVCTPLRNVQTDGQPIAYSIFSLGVSLDKKTVLAYVTFNNQGTISFADLGSAATYKDLVVSYDYSIADLDGNDDFLYVTSQQASSVEVYRIQANYYTLVHTLNRQSITKLIPDLQLFKPRELAISPVNQNILFVKNINSVIILKVTSSKVSFISNLITQSLPTEDLSERIVVGSQNFLIVRANKGAISTSIVEYGIYDIYQPTVMREIELIDREVAWPVKLNNFFGSNFVYVRTVSTASNDYSITAIRMAKPALGSNYAEFPAGENTGFIAYDSDGTSILQIAGDGAYSLNKRIFYEPYLTVSASIEDSSFKKTFTYGVTVESPTKAVPFETTLEVVNFQANINPKGQSDIKIKLPKSTNDLTFDLNVDPLFTGSLSSYSISCPDCSSDKVQLIDHVTRVADLAIPQTTQFLHIRQFGRMWALTPRGISFAGEDGKATGQYNFAVDASTTCLNWLQWDATTLVVACRANMEQFFLLVSATPNFDGVQGEPVKVIIDPAYWFTSVTKFAMAGKRLFLLDSGDATVSKGTLSVFKVGDSITGYTIFSASDFGTTTIDRINDFELLPTSMQPQRMVLLATLNDYGLGHGVFDPASDDFSLLPIGSIPLRKDERLADYQLLANNYLQIEYLDQTTTPYQTIFNVIVTTAHGEHFHLQLSFKIDPKYGLLYYDFWLYNTFNKYGKETVLNWATSHFAFNNRLNYLLVGYYDETTMKNLVTVYPISLDKGNTSIDFKGGLETAADANIPLSAELLNISNNELRIVANHPVLGMTRYYSLSDKVKLHFSYSDITKFDTLNITASNALSKASQTVAVEFDADPVPPQPDNGGGIKWYIIVIISVGVVAVLGVVLFFYIRAKKNRTDKASLLTYHKDDVDEEI